MKDRENSDLSMPLFLFNFSSKTHGRNVQPSQRLHVEKYIYFINNLVIDTLLLPYLIILLVATWFDGACRLLQLQ